MMPTLNPYQYIGFRLLRYSIFGMDFVKSFILLSFFVFYSFHWDILVHRLQSNISTLEIILCKHITKFIAVFCRTAKTQGGKHTFTHMLCIKYVFFYSRFIAVINFFLSSFSTSILIYFSLTSPSIVSRYIIWLHVLQNRNLFL